MSRFCREPNKLIYNVSAPYFGFEKIYLVKK